jgi:ABC-type bacteriocin/lantibiotic exporter with double-glycine peptidase domain
LEALIPLEGKQMSYTIGKKIVLARAILKKPKLLILEDALDQFSEQNTKSIIDFLSKPSNPWALIVVSSNSYWKTYCKEIVALKNGEIHLK